MNDLQSAARANDAIGSIFLSVFGTVWLLGWYFNTSGLPRALPFALALVAVLASAFSVRLFLQNRAAYVQYRKTSAGKRGSALLGAINGLQWAFIVGVAVLLPHSQVRWFLPAVIVIVGVHFIPLAAVMSYRPYYITSAVLIAVAGAHVCFSNTASTVAIGALGTGLVLWVTAAFQLLCETPPPEVRAPKR